MEESEAPVEGALREIQEEAWEGHDYRWCEFGYWPDPLHSDLKALFADPAGIKLIQQVAAGRP